MGVDLSSSLLNHRQRIFIKTFKKNHCNVERTCEKCTVARRTFYNWYNNNFSFREAIDATREGLIDLAESKLIGNIKAGKEASIFFFLKTQGKHRGYNENKTDERDKELDMDKVLALAEKPDEDDVIDAETE